MVATKASHANTVSTLIAETIADLQPLFDSIDLTEKCEPVAKAMCNTCHRTWTHGIDGLRHWKSNDHDSYHMRLQDFGIKMSIGQINDLNRAINEWKTPTAVPTPAAAPSPATPAAKCVVRVSCRDVKVKLTLTTKFLVKPLNDGVVVPFLKAYCQRAGVSGLTLDDVERVEIDAAIVDASAVAMALLQDGDAVRPDAAAVIFLKDGAAAVPPDIT